MKRSITYTAGLVLALGILSWASISCQVAPPAPTTGAVSAPTMAAGAPTALPPVAPATGAAPTAAPVAQPQEYDLLRVVMNNAGTGALDVVAAQHTKATQYAAMIGDFLVVIDPKTLETKAGLAKEWSVNSDATEYTFKLRDDVKFHDGTPFNAAAVKANFDDIAKAKTGSGYNALGGSLYKETTIVDPYSVKVTFTKSYVQFYQQLGTRLWFDSPTAKAKYGKDYGTKYMVSTGPYKVVEWVPDSQIVLERNDDYKWGPVIRPIQGKAFAKRIEIKGIVEGATRRAALESGQADIAMLDEGDVPDIQKDKRFKVELEPKAGTVRQLQFNLKKAPMSDLVVRQAVATAIDRDALVKAPRYSGIAIVAQGFLGKKNMGGDWPSELKPLQYSYDPKKAAQMLDGAGYKLNGKVREKDGQKLSVEMIFARGVLPEVQPIQAMLADIGIEVKLTELQTQAWFDAQAAGKFDFTIGSNSGTGYELLSNVYMTGGSSNWWGLSDPTLDGYFNTVLQSPDSKKRTQAILDAQVYMLKNVYAAPILDIYYPFGMRSEVNSVFFPLFSWPDFYAVWITK